MLLDQQVSISKEYFVLGSIVSLIGKFIHPSPISSNRCYQHKSPCSDRLKDPTVYEDSSSNDYLSNDPKSHPHQKE